MRNNNVIQDMKTQEKEEEETPIHGDLLEVVLANVPLIDLVSACRVSKSWGYAVTSSLSHLKKVKPWLIIQTQSSRSVDNITIDAYDPRSSTWIEISQITNPIKHTSTLYSSSPTFVYEHSLKELSFSSDSFHQTWHHIPPPSVWRVDPIVALVGCHVIVVGGAPYFEDNPLAVEMYDMEASNWSMCQSLPDILKDSAASTWLSVASNQSKLYVTEKASGITYSFSPETKTWSGPYNLRPDPRVFFSAIGFAGNDLILAGLIGHGEHVQTMKLWKINLELTEFSEISEIPFKLLDNLKGADSNLFSITLLASEDIIYIYNNSDPSEIIFYENFEGAWKWGSFKNIIVKDETKITERLVISCAKVGITDLHMAMKSGNCKFMVKSNV